MNNFLEEIKKKKKLVQFYYDNFRKFREENKFSKASEFLWGCINNLVSAIALTYGKKVSKYNQVEEFINQLSAKRNDEKMYKSFKLAKELHGNFFHDFMDEETFRLRANEVEELINKLAKILDDRLYEISNSEV